LGYFVSKNYVGGGRFILRVEISSVVKYVFDYLGGRGVENIPHTPQIVIGLSNYLKI